MRLSEIDIPARLRVFTDAGLIQAVPTWWQIRQGEIEMLPYVISTDATDERFYKGAPLGHPFLRQPVIFSQIGVDHLRTGCGLENKCESVCAHLHFTYHQGMPVFDLQLIQTYPGGLDLLESMTHEILERSSPRGRRHRRLVGLILPMPEDYHHKFLGPQGWIARARAFDYESAAGIPAEFFSLTGFMDYCARTFPKTSAETDALQMPGHLLKLLGRRRREGHKGQGWFKPI